MPIHPYIPNSVPEIKKKMLEEIGVKSVEELFSPIPKTLHVNENLDLPTTKSEYEVKRHVKQLLSKNKTSEEILSFLGAGCWPHYVPAVCDEINSRSEFVTAYTGDAYSDLGRYQALFEFQSMIADLVAMDMVTFPVYDWSIASADAVRMALTITGKHEIIVPKTISPERLSVIQAHCEPKAKVRLIDFNFESGLIDLEDLKQNLSTKTAAIYIENPTYLGFIETEGDVISQLAHEKGALFIVGVEPLSLGILKPPGEYGADIVCGEGQPLGMHMSYGGALLGFIACRDEERYVEATGHRIITITKTQSEGEWGFTYIKPERTMFGAREKAATYTGTATVLWAITAAVYMSLLGPQGMREIAEVIMQNSHYAMKILSDIEGLKTPLFSSPHFMEFTVNFDGTGKKVGKINKALLEYGIQGGKNLTTEFPEFGNTALYCVTEIHSQDSIDRLAQSLREVVG